jgi:hypothetical protein
MKILLLLLLAPVLHPAEVEAGNWKVTQVVASAPIAAMSDEQAAKRVGTTLHASGSGVHFADGDCPSPTFKLARTNRSEFYKGYKMTGNPLKLPMVVVTEDLGCTLLVKVRSGKVIFYWDGYFYSAVPEK